MIAKPGHKKLIKQVIRQSPDMSTQQSKFSIARNVSESEVEASVNLAHMIADPQHADQVPLPDNLACEPVSLAKLLTTVDLTFTDAPANYEYYFVTTRDPLCNIVHNPWLSWTGTQVYSSQDSSPPSQDGNYKNLYISSNSSGDKPIYGQTYNGNSLLYCPMYYKNSFWYNIPSASSIFRIHSNTVAPSSLDFRVRILNNGGVGQEFETIQTMASGQQNLDITGLSPGSYLCVTPTDAALKLLGSAVLNITLTVAATNEECVVTLPIPDIANVQDIDSVKVSAASCWYMNTSAVLNLGGSVCTMQKPAGTMIWESNDFDAVARAQNSSEELRSATGAYSFLKPMQVSELIFYDLKIGGTRCWNGKMKHDSMVTVIRNPVAASRDGVMKVSTCIEFRSPNRLYSIVVPDHSPNVLNHALESIRHIPQFYSNESHLANIGNGIKNTVVKGVSLLKSTISGVAKFIRNHGAEIATIAKMAGTLAAAI